MTTKYTHTVTAASMMRPLMLIAENEDGDYEPVAVVSSVDEARELAKADIARRNPDTDPCPYVYKVWDGPLMVQRIEV